MFMAPGMNRSTTTQVSSPSRVRKTANSAAAAHLPRTKQARRDGV